MSNVTKDASQLEIDPRSTLAIEARAAAHHALSEPATATNAQPTAPPAPVGALHRFFATLRAAQKRHFLGHEVASELSKFLASDSTLTPQVRKSVSRLLRGCPEVFLDGDTSYATLRPKPGIKRTVRLHPSSTQLEEVSRGEFLRMKDRQVQGDEEASKLGLVIDFSPYYRDFPQVSEAAEMGDGISVLHRRLSAQMYQNADRFRESLLKYLRERRVDGQSILVGDHVRSAGDFAVNLAAVRADLDEIDEEPPLSKLIGTLRSHGFEPGWGASLTAIRETLYLLARVIESADASHFADLMRRLPLVRTVLMVSPHGWFAQEGVLGKPDTGGQVTYVLDQARAIERQINDQLAACGLDATGKVIILTRLIPEAEGTTCSNPREAVHGASDSWILRVPFREPAGGVHPAWVSRFQIWPYLEDFAEESRQAVVTELLGAPDLIIGHYSDGNLVAHLLAEQLGTTHCACVHALEKTKYLLSDTHWAELEGQYHFSKHFTADLLSYNSADYVVSSSLREIGGTEDEQGMIEAHDLFSMPGLYRVQSGLNPRLARHNVIPPGVSEEFFFPAGDPRRVPELSESLSRRLLGEEPAEGCLGTLARPELPMVFAMARMDKIKNLPSLIEMFAAVERLRENANLLLVTSLNRSEDAKDAEEVEEIARAHRLIDQYGLHGSVRWCAARLDKSETGEIYRLIADGRGVFAQPALMETFGLTVIEAMACSLPVVGTCFGGPSEIIEHGASGLVADPTDIQAFGQALADVVTDRDRWCDLSQGGIDRVQSAYTWKLHAERLLGTANVYSYWNHTDVMNRPALDRYIHTLYHAVYRPRVMAMDR
ncbi:MAG: sucrose synthase [Planctomycetota bacterium]